MADGTHNDGDFSEQHKIEKDEEEIEKQNAAIEHFDSNQEAVKKKLNELPSEINDDLEVEETGQKMYEVMNDSEMEDDVQKHLNQRWLDHHLYLSQLSSDDSDLDLGNSENDEDLKIKKESNQENQGTTANPEFTDQDRNDKVEDAAKISELSPLQDKSEKNKEENEKLTAAIEQFDSDQESFKKKLNELSSEFDDNLENVDLEVEETELKMTGMFNESKTADDVEKHLDQLRLKFDFQFQLSSDDGSDLDIENSENVEDYVGNLKIKKLSNHENQGTIANAEFTDQDRNEKIEDEIPAKKSKLSPIVKTFDQKRSKFNRLAREVKDELAWMTRVKEEHDAKFQQSKLKLAKLKQRNSDMEMEVFELFKNRIRIIMEQPADHELRDKIKSWLESQTEKAETKMESTQTQIEGRTKRLRRCLRIWKCCDKSDLDLQNSENVGDLKIKKQSDPENQDQKQKMGLDQESVALKLIFDDLETEIPRLQVHLARLTQQKEELVDMFQQLKFELEKQKQKNSDMKMEEPADHELRDKIKSGLESQPTKPKTKMESTLNQTLSGAKDSRRCLRICKCWDAVKTLK